MAHKRHTYKNLLILGANGTLAHAFLAYFKHHRQHFRRLVLLDQHSFKQTPYAIRTK